MTFKEVEHSLPNGFHDAKIERISLDYPAGTLQIAMRILIGKPGEPDQDEYGPAELRVSGLYFCSIEPPDPTYPFKPNGKPLGVSGDDSEDELSGVVGVLGSLPRGISCYRFFVDQWNSFIHIAASDVQISSSGVPRSLDSITR
jgi:hypothetical protein